MQNKLWFLLVESPPIFPWPSEVRLVLNVFQYLVNKLFEHNVYPFRTLCQSIPGAFDSLLALGWNFSIQYSLRYYDVARALPLPCNWLSSNFLYSSILLINWYMSLGGRIARESLNSDSSGSSNQKVFAATCSFPPPISLYNSQYLFYKIEGSPRSSFSWIAVNLSVGELCYTLWIGPQTPTLIHQSFKWNLSLDR